MYATKDGLKCNKHIQQMSSIRWLDCCRAVGKRIISVGTMIYYQSSVLKLTMKVAEVAINLCYTCNIEVWRMMFVKVKEISSVGTAWYSLPHVTSWLHLCHFSGLGTDTRHSEWMNALSGYSTPLFRLWLFISQRKIRLFVFGSHKSGLDLTNPLRRLHGIFLMKLVNTLKQGGQRRHSVCFSPKCCVILLLLNKKRPNVIAE